MIKVNLNREAFQIALARRNLTQRALALDMHTNPHYLTEIVTGRRSLSPYMRQRLLSGELPQWLPYEGLGVPLVGQIHGAALGDR